MPDAQALLRGVFYTAVIAAVIAYGAVDDLVFFPVAGLIFGCWLCANLVVPLPAELARIHAFLNWLVIAIIGFATFQLLPLPLQGWLNPAVTEPLPIGDVSRAISIDPSATVASAFKIVVALAALSTSLLLHQDEVKAARSIRRGALLGGIIIGATLIQFMLFPGSLLLGIKEHYRDSFTATFVNRNTAATFCAIVLITSLVVSLNDIVWQHGGHSRRSILVSRSVWSGWAIRLAVAISAVGLALTKSRAGVASTALPVLVVTGIYAYQFARRSAFSLGSLGSLGKAAIVVVAIAAIGILLFDRVLVRFEVQGAESSRWCVYETMLAAIAQRPWFGFGLGSFQTLYPLRRDPACGIYGEWEYLHSVYLEILVSGGFVLLLFLGVFVFFILKIIFERIKKRRSFRSILIASLSIFILIILHSIFDFSIQIPAISILFSTILGISLPLLAKTESRS